MEAVQRLISTRWGTFIAATGAALTAGIILLVSLNHYRQEVKAQGTPVTVLVARETIPKGTSGSVIASKGLYSATTIREGQLKEGAISDPASLKGKVAAQEIYEGSQLTLSSLAPAGDSLAGTLADRERIVTVPLDSAHGLVNELETGNRVDVYAGFNVVPLARNGAPISGGQARPMLRLIVANVPVVKIGGQKKGGSGTSDVSLRVDDVKAAQLAFASDNGKLWLALRPSAGAKSVKPGIVTVETLLLGVPPVQVIRSVGGRS
jgi:Flp pilus assembly protein CpaB